MPGGDGDSVSVEILITFTFSKINKFRGILEIQIANKF